jgi:hypothetical protein
MTKMQVASPNANTKTPRYGQATTASDSDVEHLIAYQHSETNVMHFLFNLLGIRGLYVFRALLAHSQEALNKRHLVYWS